MMSRFNFQRKHLFIAVFVLVLILFTGLFVVLINTVWNTINRDTFLSDLRLLFGISATFLFFVLIYIAKIVEQTKDTSRTQSILPASFRHAVWSWVLGIVVTAALAASLIIYINPRAMYGTAFYTPLTNPARYYKPEAFLELEQTPDLVVMGSSRAFTIQPSHIEEVTGLSSFNFSLDNGKINDALIAARFMNEQNEFPRVILLEIRGGLASSPSYTSIFSPLEMVRYMSWQTVGLFLKERIQGLFSLQQLTEALYILQYYRWYSVPDLGWRFSMDGSGEFIFPSRIAAELEQELALQPYACPEITDEGVEDAEALLQEAQSHHTSVIFYLPPMPARYYDVAVRNNAVYAQCYATLLTYIERFKAEYQRVFFLDFSDVNTFYGLSNEAGFYDVKHSTALNNNLLIDTAAPTILEAFQAAQAMISNPSPNDQ